MISNQVDPKELKDNPGNKGWTEPRSWGVWEVSTTKPTRKYHEGNNPVRERELIRDYGSVNRIALYLDKASAVEHAKELNNE